MLKKIALLASIITIILAVPTWEIHAETCDHDGDEVYATCGPCWAVSIQFITEGYNYYRAWQGYVTRYACQHYVDICPGCFPPWDLYFPECPYMCTTWQDWGIPGQTVVKLMHSMGFLYHVENSVLSEAEIHRLMCDFSKKYVMPVCGDHILVIDGHDDQTHTCYTNDTRTNNADISYTDLLEKWISGTIVTYGFIESLDWGDWVSIGDIIYFTTRQFSSVVQLEFQILSTADPEEKAAVYITDNTLGPARLVESLVEIPDLEPAVNYWYHTLYPYNDDYYYFLDHGGPNNSIRSMDLLKASATNPLSFIDYDVRPIFDAPDNVTASDKPLDNGNTLVLEWQLSNNDSVIDCYNIYKSESFQDSITNEFVYVTSVPPGTSTFTDTTVLLGLNYWYKVSTAHHGTEELLDGCYAIWNDFCSQHSNRGTPVNNLKNHIYFASSEYENLVVCPAGDADTLEILITIQGTDSIYGVSIPKESICLIPFGHDSLYFCSNDTIHAIADTDEFGTTKFRYAYIGGCESAYFQAEVYEVPSDNILTVHIKSFDLNGDGSVNLLDLEVFGRAMYTTCEDPDYIECADYMKAFCNINIIDMAMFAFHYNNCSCP